jgi:Sedlin, N-terminal conserved region
MSQGGSILFVIVGRNEPLFEAEFTNSNSNKPSSANSNSNNQQHQHDTAIRQNYFVLHSALDLVEKAAWTTSNMYLRVVDKVGFMDDFVLHKENSIACYQHFQINATQRNATQRNATHHCIQKQTISFL